MASLQTHVLVNDEWVAQNVTAEELYKTSHSHAKTTMPIPPASPKLGVLTKTIIESPITRWVLPVQLRSPRFNDVALIGICELSVDTQIQPIARKVGFGSTIRSCQVMGTHDYLNSRREDVHANYYRGGESGTMRSNSSTSTSLPKDIDLFQQVLILALSSGELVFLFMKSNTAGDWEFVSSHHSISSGKLVDPGFHMTISPCGRYLALACSEDLFIVYQLESVDEVRRQHSEGFPIKPIRSTRARAVKGVVHKLDFLHPGSENASHIVLLVVTVRSGVVRLAAYEWEDSELLHEALDVAKPGHRLDEAIGLPLLVIPLTIHRQFLLITERSMAICSNILAGPPDFVHFELPHRDVTHWHHGNHTPTWTAWTRPSREGSYHSDTDMIYLAREDGWLNRLEISDDSGIESSIYMGPLECRIDSGFASLSFPYGDLLVVGGDCGPGGIWSVQPRQDIKSIDLLPNWSPALDLVLTKDTSEFSKSNGRNSTKQPSWPGKTQSHMLAPERVFTCSGIEKSGAIVELRYGIQAKVGLDLLYPSPIKRCWAIPSFDGTPEAGFCMLLALPEHSALLHISHDLSKVSERVQNTVDFDLLSTTLAVYVSREVVIQITTRHATIMSPATCYQHSISDVIGDPLATVADAAVTDETLALSVYSQSAFRIMVFTVAKTGFLLNQVFNVEGEITALCVSKLSNGVCVLAGLSQEYLSTLGFFPIDFSLSKAQMPIGPQKIPIRIKLIEHGDVDPTSIDAVTSIVSLENEVIKVGMRNGKVLTIQPTEHNPMHEYAVTRTTYFGVSPSQVFAGMMFDTGPSTLICNDEGLAMMKEPGEESNTGSFEEIFRVWLTDANELHAPSPLINSVARLHEIPGCGDCTWAMVSGSHILITELQRCPTPVPRYIPTKGTPFGLLYSERLEALVTVIMKCGIPSLHFFDPITGADLSRPVKKISDQDPEQIVDIEYIRYLDNPEISIVSLLDWRYKDEGHSYEWFVILARSRGGQGRLLVVSAEQEAAVTNNGISRRIRFWTQFYRKIKEGSPRVGATDSNGLFLNFGKTLEYHIIEDKKFTTAVKYDLPSPATYLEVVDGDLHVLTTHHSLIILDYTSDAALKSQRMVQLFADEVARNGLHSIDVKSVVGIEQQRFVLVSDPMCGVYGLWSPGRNFDIADFQLVFRVDLTVSIRKFVHGRTRPRWANDQPRYGVIPSDLGRHDILGLAIDGSLTQFTILNEDVLRILRYIQDLAIAFEETYVITDRYAGTNKPEPEPEPNSIPRAKTHIDGDILQRCLEAKSLERIVATPQQLARLQELLKATYHGIDIASLPTTNTTPLAYKYVYGILEYYLSPTL